MHAIATRADFNRLSPEQQEKFATLVFFCKRTLLPCRCEMIDNRDFVVTIGPGLPHAQHWIDRLDLDET